MSDPQERLHTYRAKRDFAVTAEPEFNTFVARIRDLLGASIDA